MNKFIVEASSVDRIFPPATYALADVSFQVEYGERVAIVGPSGSGKSTLLAVLGLLDRPSSGSVVLDGMDVSGLSDRERTRMRRITLAFVFQAFHLIPHLTALENVSLAHQISRLPSGQRNAHAIHALDAVGLSHRVSSRPGELSGGEQQRVAVARAIVRRPRLLLCDEPTGNLDSDSSRRVMDAILGPALRNSAIVIVTHDNDIAAMCDRVVRLLDGTPVEE